MKENDNEIFDLKVRELLSDGSEQVPEGIWDAVCGRLDAMDADSGAARVKRLDFRRAAIAVAAAAAVVCGVFLGIHRDGAESGNVAMTADAGQVQIVEGEVAVPDAEGLMDVRTGLIAEAPSSKTAESSGSLKNIVPDSVPSYGEASTPAVEGSSASVVEESSSSSSEDSTAPASEESSAPAEDVSITSAGGKDGRFGTGDSFQGYKSDPFASLDTGDGSSRRTRTSFVASTSASGNTLSSSSFSPVKSYAFGVKTAQVPKTDTITETGESRYAIPVSFGLGARFMLDKHWSLGTGISLSSLKRSFAGNYTCVDETGDILSRKAYSDIVNTQIYIGIPLNVYYSIISNGPVDVYVWGGGTVEKCVSNKFTLPDTDRNTVIRQSASGVQASAGAGFGIEFCPVGRIGLYFDPNIRYYFDCGQPNSIRTKEPLMLGFEAGVRFKL